ncbi:tRNA (adenosine(37)-N6)-threonylcarbamoyltransferase complex ATPase subunit type 1 TsaE [Bacteroidota bacterium]
MIFEAKKVSDLRGIAEQILHLIKSKKIVAFYGEMGVGKTTFIKIICNLLNVVDTISSPTFALVYEYRTEINVPVYHFDFYRIKETYEVYDYGYEEYFYSGNICLLEWPEKIESLLPENTLKIKIETGPEDLRYIHVLS